MWDIMLQLHAAITTETGFTSRRVKRPQDRLRLPNRPLVLEAVPGVAVEGQQPSPTRVEVSEGGHRPQHGLLKQKVTPMLIPLQTVEMNQKWRVLMTPPWKTTQPSLASGSP